MTPGPPPKPRQATLLELWQPCTRCQQQTATRCTGCAAVVCEQHMRSGLCQRCYALKEYAKWD